MPLQGTLAETVGDGAGTGTWETYRGGRLAVITGASVGGSLAGMDPPPDELTKATNPAAFTLLFGHVHAFKLAINPKKLKMTQKRSMRFFLPSLIFGT